MKIAIMQPYYFPYIGYWQLIKSVDYFVLYDEGKYIQRGWMSRNQILRQGKTELFGLEISKRSCNKKISEIEIAENELCTNKRIKGLQTCYGKAPFYEETMALVKRILSYPERNLFLFLKHEIIEICKHLEIDTKLCVSSELTTPTTDNAIDKIFSICNVMECDEYVNAIGGMKFYDKEFFLKNGAIHLSFIKTAEIEYQQIHTNEFVPNMSIIDVLMCNGRINTMKLLNQYTLI